MTAKDASESQQHTLTLPTAHFSSLTAAANSVRLVDSIRYGERKNAPAPPACPHSDDLYLVASRAQLCLCGCTTTRNNNWRSITINE